MGLTPEDIAEIIRFLDQSPFDELVVQTSGLRVTVQRTRKAVVASRPSRPDPKTALVEVTAPTPGIFFRASGPGQPPFVEPGSDVREDTIVGIVEVMKLMNPVPAGVRGRVVEICVENGQMVDEGQVLVRLEPNSRG